MILDPYMSFLELLTKAWRRKKEVRKVITLAFALAVLGILVFLASRADLVNSRIADPLATALAIIGTTFAGFVAALQDLSERRVREEKIETVEMRVREHPEKPQLAWDLARVKLENYLDRNLSQVRSIYWLTLVVMVSGFGFVSYGLFEASNNPEKLPISIVASASGVLISFIGGSFLIIYRAILAQSKGYVTVLERINAVGMAVQVIDTIPEGNGALKDRARADLASQLLRLYAAPTLPGAQTTEKT